MLELKTLKLDKINYEDKEHLYFLKDMCKSKDIKYLWDLSDESLINNKNDDNYIVIDKDNMVGYINISDYIDGRMGKTVSIYYGVLEKFRGKGYGKKIVTEINDWLINERNIDCIIAQVNRNNIYSNLVLNKAGMDIVMENDDYTTFIQKR